MIVKNIILLVVVSFIHLVSHAQQCNGTFMGQVLDESNRPLIGATVLISPPEKGVVTSSAGNFRFDKLCAATYIIKVQYLGFESLEFEVTIDGVVEQVI